MSQKLPVNDCKQVEDIYRYKEDFIKIYSDNNDDRYFLEVDLQQPKKIHYLPLLPEIMKIEKIEKLKASLHDKIKYIFHIKNLRESLNFNFFKLMNNLVFDKIQGNIRKHRVSKLVTMKRRRNYVVSQIIANRKNIKSNWTNERLIRSKDHEKFVELRAKFYSFLIDNCSEDKKIERQKRVFSKKKI